MTTSASAPPRTETPARPVSLPAAVKVAAWGGLFAAALQVLPGLVMVAGLWYLQRPEGVPRAAPTVVAEFDGEPFVGAETVVRPAPHRDSPRRALVGPVYADGEIAGGYEMRLRNSPVTFVTPRSWGCLSATARVDGVEVDAAAWRCIDEKAGRSRPQLDIVLRHCPTSCTAADRAQLDQALEHRTRYTERDPATRLAEQSADGRYLLSLDRVFAVADGGPGQWLLVLQADARPADTGTVQKIVNDIYSQTL